MNVLDVRWEGTTGPSTEPQTEALILGVGMTSKQGRGRKAEDSECGPASAQGPFVYSQGNGAVAQLQDGRMATVRDLDQGLRRKKHVKALIWASWNLRPLSQDKGYIFEELSEDREYEANMGQ